ncbi:MAG: Holliday junction resolvase RuvX [Lutisporaceae bacterium]
MRMMGLDVGDATIGVAASDELGMMAHGITTIRRTKLDNDLDSLKNIINEKNIKRIVVGLPKNMNNTIGPRGQISIDFAELLKEKFPELEIEMWDERLTTVAATRVLIEADMSRKKRKTVIDKVAAVFILQNYLDMQSSKKL